MIRTFYKSREKPEDNKGLPKIPAQPIGYADARKLLEKMGGKDSPVAWKGGMEGIAYKVKFKKSIDRILIYYNSLILFVQTFLCKLISIFLNRSVVKC